MASGGLKACPKWKIEIIVLILIQLIIFIGFVIFVRYDDHFENMLSYASFQHVHTMIFVGFGFIMTFLSRYGFSSVGYNFLLSSTMIQWAIICQGLFHLTNENTILINLSNLWSADVAAASTLISMGALLGQTSYIQLIIMGIIEVVFYSSNVYICDHCFKARDPGGSMYVHLFGAYYGLAACFVLNVKKTVPADQNKLEKSSYVSDIFAMIGTLFLWIYWPSVNSIELVGSTDKQRAIINTYLSLASSCTFSFIFSMLLDKEHKFNMVHIQNSTLTGGVAVGTVVFLIIETYGAIVIGSGAALVSVVGYRYLSPFMRKRLKIYDTCGVHNLHGLPGLLGGLLGVIMAMVSDEAMYRNDRNSTTQAMYQLAALTLTLVFAVVGGLLAGTILRFVVKNSAEKRFDDAAAWVLES